MRRSLIALVGLVVLFGMLMAVGASAQTTAASAPGSQPQAQGKAKVVFEYSQPIPLKYCLEQTAIQIDGVTVHQIFQWHIWQTELAPGTHIFSDDSHKDKGLTATLTAGQTYYYALKGHRAGFVPKCENCFNKVAEMSSKEVSKAVVLLGKPGMDESIASGPSPATAAAPVAAAVPESPRNTNVKLAILSTPEAADIEVDGSFVGNTPSAVELTPGEHTVIISKKGFWPWKRTIKLGGGDVKLNAELERATPGQ